MDMISAVTSLDALAQPTRLSVFRLLVAAEPQGLPAGEIAKKEGVPHNTMSTHLAILERAGLVTSRRHGRSVIYRAHLESLRNLMLFFVRDCCSGKPELCMPLIEDLTCNCQPLEGASCA